ncbi:hypothetical protein LK07_29850 [Streptomyces pluripotens]|uniref:Uncharacterized protein n=1 Tax=Streptomyces pluripotens TaxID=1355015 RepID=A0A221P5K3_9ACTN|nr:hypothetical protein LK07_29850 [Streptomyces pluripotens]
MRFGQCGSGSRDRPPVSAALSAVGAGGRCSEVRHLRPRTGPSACSRGAPCGHASSRRRPTGPGIRPCVARRTLTVVACASCAVGS